jgi:hypothetical protein
MQQLFTFVPSAGTKFGFQNIANTGKQRGNLFVSINKSYFRRQAPLLRRMVRLAQDPIVADRLSEMVRAYEMKGNDGPEEAPPVLDAKGDKDHGQKN